MVYWGMGIWNRLGNVIKSYLNDEDKKIFGSGGGYSSPGNPDLESAFEELNEYLNVNKSRSANAEPGPRRPESGNKSGAQRVPESLRADFAELGVDPGAAAEECKAAYKRLLKIHHPDRHAGHPENFKKATNRTARINAAYDRIEKWRKNGGI
jgi:hypothetical protein